MLRAACVGVAGIKGTDIVRMGRLRGDGLWGLYTDLGALTVPYLYPVRGHDICNAELPVLPCPLVDMRQGREAIATSAPPMGRAVRTHDRRCQRWKVESRQEALDCNFSCFPESKLGRCSWPELTVMQVVESRSEIPGLVF